VQAYDILHKRPRISVEQVIPSRLVDLVVLYRVATHLDLGTSPAAARSASLRCNRMLTLRSWPPAPDAEREHQKKHNAWKIAKEIQPTFLCVFVVVNSPPPCPFLVRFIIFSQYTYKRFKRKKNSTASLDIAGPKARTQIQKQFIRGGGDTTISVQNSFSKKTFKTL